jgi:hypothetical protein
MKGVLRSFTHFFVINFRIGFLPNPSIHSGPQAAACGAATALNCNIHGGFVPYVSLQLLALKIIIKKRRTLRTITISAPMLLFDSAQSEHSASLLCDPTNLIPLPLEQSRAVEI